MIVEIFRPLEFKRKNIDIDNLNSVTSKSWNYAANGKSALYHCLKSLNVTGSILIPAYVCDSILIPINELDLKIYYYDINLDDLNADAFDIEKKIVKYDISCVVIASLYGNAAKLDIIEEICKQNNVIMIDDAAQSFGATLNEKYVGTFGNAGFFSFSPGKATTAHMGAYFWTQNESYKIIRTKHLFFHYLSYLDFYFNRLHIYKYKKWMIFRFLPFFKNILSKYVNVLNDDICGFEKQILGGVLDENFKQTFRNKFVREFNDKCLINDNFTTITKGKNEDNNHKLVLLFKKEQLCTFYYNLFWNHTVYCSKGYSLLSDSEELVNSIDVSKRIIELPIENDKFKFDSLCNLINKI